MKKLAKLLSIVGLFIFSVVDTSGQSLIYETVGNSGNDYGEAVALMPDSGFVIAGSTNGFGLGSTQTYVIRMDVDGNMVWGRQFGGSGPDWGSAVQQNHGSIYVAGYTFNQTQGYQGSLSKMSGSGDIEYSQNYGGDNWDFLNDMQIQHDTLFMTGQSYSNDNGSPAGWFLKTDTAGNIILNAQLQMGEMVKFNKILPMHDGGAICVGAIKLSAANDTDRFMARFNSNGDTLWTKTFVRAGEDELTGISSSTSYSFYIAGTIPNGFYGGTDMWIAKYKLSDMTVLWEQNFGGPADDFCNNVSKPQNNKIALSGSTRSFGGGSEDAFVVVSDTLGNLNLNLSKSAGGQNVDRFNAVSFCNDQYYLSIGSSNSFTNNFQVLILRIDGSETFSSPNNISDVITGIKSQSLNSTLLNVYPNPVQKGKELFLKTPNRGIIKIYSTTGEMVYSKFIDQSIHQISIPDLNSGIYILSFSNSSMGNTSQRVKLIVE